MEQRIFCPQGYRDELYPRSLRRRRMEMRITEYLAGSGYQMVETPEVEYYDLYARYDMPVGQEQMVKFVDSTGRLVVLRPDFTLPAARIMSSALSARRTPIKLFYTGRVYRVGGRGGEVSSGQTGGEIYGESGIWPAAECIMTIWGAMERCGVSDFKVELGDVDIARGLLREAGVPEAELPGALRAIDEKNAVELARLMAGLDLAPEKAKLILELPFLIGDPLTVTERFCTLGGNPDSCERLLTLCEQLRQSGLGDRVILDLGMHPKFDYYTGLVFRGYAEGAADLVFAGGCYDSLLKLLGRDMTACGFALYTDRIFEAAQVRPTPERRVLLLYGEGGFAQAHARARLLASLDVPTLTVPAEDVKDPASYMAENGCDTVERYGDL